MRNSHHLLAYAQNRIAQVCLSLALVGMSLVHAASAQAQLVWTNVFCIPPVGGIECPQIGTPPFACQCGFWKDSPASTALNGETVYVFVKSMSEIDETGKWRAPLPQPYFFNDIFRARAAANDSSILQIFAYDQIGAGTDWATCTDGVQVVARLQWGPADDNSIFSIKSQIHPAPITVRGLCIILTDDPNSVIPVSRRSTAQVDYIQLENDASGNVVTLETFQLLQ